jgi:hypothetical protein
MTGDMSTRIKPRKKALRKNRKPTLTGHTVLLALMVALGAAGRCNAQVEQPSLPVSSPAVGGAAQGDAPPADSPINTDAPPAAPTAPRPRSHRPPHATPAQVIDANVHRLAQGLKLDQEQQRKLREILVDQYAQLMKLRTESVPGTDRTGAMLAMVDRTRERIHEMLNDEQKKQYATEVPREMTAATRADLERWLEVRDAQRRVDTQESK